MRQGIVFFAGRGSSGENIEGFTIFTEHNVTALWLSSEVICVGKSGI
jgi:hypothetical protein